MPSFSAAELTGQARSHVVDLTLDAPGDGSAGAAARIGLHGDVVQPFLLMRAAAADSGIDLAPASGFRDFERQLEIWNGKYRGERPLLDEKGRPLNVRELSSAQRVAAILVWSALPGASRHHWGTEIDVIDRAALAPGQQFQLLPAEFADGGVFARLGQWLAQHGGRFGFYRPYDRDRGGVQPEPWHLSYAPLSRQALTELTLATLEQSVAAARIEGRETVLAMLPEIYRRYVCAVAEPDAALLAALNREARPS